MSPERNCSKFIFISGLPEESKVREPLVNHQQNRARRHGTCFHMRIPTFSGAHPETCHFSWVNLPAFPAQFIVFLLGYNWCSQHRDWLWCSNGKPVSVPCEYLVESFSNYCLQYHWAEVWNIFNWAWEKRYATACGSPSWCLGSFQEWIGRGRKTK